ncbi:D-aminoacyl-tRNA deacylase [Jonesia denitrificans]|uniref:D-aminoacyl-tRNA deacylase n=1 Tax=Jonesia denitrificans (strain ATCC 14870 / DSM 20603 / BCRC 15368 / CIP 55.134 / JCM 11481 / NBRC 15587 / NCTC 10816 / Prevot 55134) TaxID=471856 RepID=C7R053_JONDD|nr:D-aminoacyl-tRNA deacylase [Jonesia denitrificans]ACV08112.1 D-tyrosyl-tRNA(Tyr) deacylase [Jonesia denitrificans DSM 20603]ASE08211.1 D-tyrosyl-tRNA(Tyr) deacylase [Jonesia denitrificans]QXB42809.1 D-tyrosyl-tRNA(Tyr) deacylase [Jonesia denitrificans]SQH20093.1 D-tyrosyl-tRNA(Tyr) deacylase [Jonesia denitrificans]
MRAILQRASAAKVTVDSVTVAEFDRQGIVALIGVTHTDTTTDAATIARKIADLRILDHEQSVTDAHAPVIVVSQFTLYADVAKGRRPSWNNAAPAPVAEPLVNAVVNDLTARGISTSTGVFGAHMDVHLTNDGPVTIIVDT